MDTWKVLLGLAGVLVLFGVVISVLDTGLPPIVLVAALGFLLVSLFVTLRSYRLGRQIGTKLAEDEDR